MNPQRLPLITALTLAVMLSMSACSNESAEGAPDLESRAQGTAAGASAEAAETPAAGKQEDATATAPPGPEGEMPAGPDHPFLSTFFAETYEKDCTDAKADAARCEVLRGLLVIETVMALEELDRARDQRGAPVALAALDFDQEPEILIAALRVLGQFPDTPGIAEKALPLLLESPWLMVQELASRVLNGNPDQAFSAVGSLWNSNHSALYADFEYTEYPDFAPHYPDMGFPEYPNAEWFSPVDSDRSVGWSTTDDAATVIGWMRDALDVEPFDPQQWTEYTTAQSMAVYQAMDQGKQEELQRLTEEYLKNQDPALMERAQKLQQEIYAPMENAAKMAELGVGNIMPPYLPGVAEEARFFVAEEKDGHVARLVIVYPLAALGRTVIQEAWSLADYPSAWPPAAPL